MVKIIFLVICIIAAFGGSSTLTSIDCNYGVYRYFLVGSIYECKVDEDPNILTAESAEISGISGEHGDENEDSKTNDDVLSIYAKHKTIQFFPKGLDNFFKNIKLIFIESCGLKEIHQSDLKAFPKLVYFGLVFNEIEVIEAGLFDFNPNLEVLEFEESKLIQIDPNVFDHLTKLSTFWFSKVPCVGKDVYNSQEQVQEVIQVVKSNCSNSVKFSAQIEKV